MFNMTQKPWGRIDAIEWTMQKDTLHKDLLQKLIVNTWFACELSQNTSFVSGQSLFEKTKKLDFYTKIITEIQTLHMLFNIRLFEVTLLTTAQIYEKSCSKKKHSVR